MSRFMYWLTGFLRVRVIKGDHGEPYLERYRLFTLAFTRRRSVFAVDILVFAIV